MSLLTYQDARPWARDIKLKCSPRCRLGRPIRSTAGFVTPTDADGLAN